MNLPAEHAVNFLSPKTTTKGKQNFDEKGERKVFLNQKGGIDVQVLRAGAGSTGRGCGDCVVS